MGRTYKKIIIEIKDEQGYKMPVGRLGGPHKVKGQYTKGLRKKINDKIKKGEYDL